MARHVIHARLTDSEYRQLLAVVGDLDRIATKLRAKRWTRAQFVRDAVVDALSEREQVVECSHAASDDFSAAVRRLRGRH